MTAKGVSMWDFETEPAFREKLDWMDVFVREEVEPLDVLFPDDVYKRPMDPRVVQIVNPLKQAVRDKGLWACHLGPDLGGAGYGQLKLALMNEILGPSPWAPTIFGTQAPDTGNAEILAHYGTDRQKAAYLQPLLDGDIVSCYSMTEPQGGSDPKEFTTAARRDGDEWVIDGWKYFSSNARWAAFLLVMAVTNPDVEIYRGASMFIVPADTTGIDIVRNVTLFGDSPDSGSHALVHYEGVRVPVDNLLGGEGNAFAIAQTRLGGGRIHHAMRTVGQAQKALDMMIERALSRHTQGTLLADKQAVQAYIADSYAEISQLRLFVLQTAWKIDKYKDYSAVRHDIATAKVLMAQVLQNVAQRALQVHGALGASDEMPLARLLHLGALMALVDGPSEVHRTTAAKTLLKQGRPADGMWPSEWIPAKLEAASAKYADLFERGQS
jgi:acyl-CoA dehydrogenase